MITFHLSNEAQQNLKLLAISDPLVVTRLKAFLEQAACEPAIIAKALTTHAFNDSNIDIKKWLRQHNLSHPIWRLKFCCFQGKNPDYRIFYSLEKSKRKKLTVYILGIKRRDEIDYDDDNNLAGSSIITAFQQCCTRIHM